MKTALLLFIPIILNDFINQIYEGPIQIEVLLWWRYVGKVQFYGHLKQSCDSQDLVVIIPYQRHVGRFESKHHRLNSYEYQVLVVIILFLEYGNLFLACENLIPSFSIRLQTYVLRL